MEERKFWLVYVYGKGSERKQKGSEREVKGNEMKGKRKGNERKKRKTK